MAAEDGQSQEADLDRTDKLAVLEGTSADDDVADDAVPLKFSPVTHSVRSQFRRASPADPPSLAASVRSVEERIARRNAEYEALTLAHAGARAAEALAAARATALAAELAALRTSLESEQSRSRELGRTLAAREAAVAQVTRSLAERDAQLSALQREHAQIVPSLEERSTAAEHMGADLRAARARLASVTAELDRARQGAATLSSQVRRGQEELEEARRDLDDVKAQAASLLERLRTREFRRALEESDEAQAAPPELISERDELRRRIAELSAKLAARDETVEKSQSALSAEAERGKEMLSAAEQSRADLALEVLRLRAEAQEQESQMEVLLAHLQEARRLIGRGEGEPPRPAAASPAAKSPIAPASGGVRSAGAAPEWTAELIRTDGGRSQAHALDRRTRIGRAPGCELHIDSSSVSRYHALVLTNAHDVIVEDLNSTNGVLVNGRKVSRQLLTDGDVLTIGEAQFRLAMKPVVR